MVEQLRSMKLKEAAKKVEDGIEETLTYCDFPSEHWMIIPGLFEPPVRTLRATIPENESHIFR